MAFKLRSGNNTPFKKMGEEKETVDQYNARVKAEYDSKMQSYNDSTTSHNNRVKYIEKFNESNEIKKDVKYAADQSRGHTNVKSGEYVPNTTAINPELDKDMDYSNGTPNYISPRRKLTAKEIAHNKEADKKFDEAAAKSEEGFSLFEKNLDSGIYSSSGYKKNPNDLRPKVLPKEPGYLIETKGLELMPIENDLSEPKVEKSKLKYMTSKDGKTKTNLETGEKTKVKTKTVKGGKRKKKRKVKNLVTGKNNKIQ